MKKNDIQKATFQRYLEASGIIRKLFGNIQLKDMNDIVVQRKIDEYAKKRSHSTTRSLLIKVKMALRDAYAHGYLTNDFAELVKPRVKELSKRNETKQSVIHYGLPKAKNISTSTHRGRISCARLSSFRNRYAKRRIGLT
ncbi:hypothetical protein [Bacillus haynesii]|uniref:hypothetical protein n=1 Tax=Bacillus haynesii TaxID=1925021 RepID=UPI0012B7A6B6